LFSGQNFRTTNPRKPTKGSVDADFCLICFERNKKLLLVAGAQDSMTSSRKNEKRNLPQIWRHPQRNSNPKLINF